MQAIHKEVGRENNAGAVVEAILGHPAMLIQEEYTA